MENQVVASPLDTMQGAFVSSLIRNNKKIREDRAIAIVEDIQLEIKKITREREAMLDLSPTTADSLVLASDFNSKQFVEKDLQLGLKIRDLKIKLEVAQDRYNTLFTNQTTN